MNTNSRIVYISYSDEHELTRLCRLTVLGLSLAPFLGYVIESRAGRDRARIQFEQFKSRQIKNRESLCRILHARVINSWQDTR